MYLKPLQRSEAMVLDFIAQTKVVKGGIRTMAKELHLHNDTIGKAVKKLLTLGIIKRQHRKIYV